MIFASSGILFLIFVLKKITYVGYFFSNLPENVKVNVKCTFCFENFDQNVKLGYEKENKC